MFASIMFYNLRENKNNKYLFLCMFWSLLACVSFSGTWAFTWWHISPYLIGNGLFLFSYIIVFSELSKFLNSKQYTKIFIITFILSITFLINEIYLISSIVFLFLLYIFKKFNQTIINDLGFKLVLKSTLIASLFYCILNFLDVFLHSNYLTSISHLNIDRFTMDLNFIKISNALFDVTLLSIVSLYENTITHIFYGKELVDFTGADEPFLLTNH